MKEVKTLVLRWTRIVEVLFFFLLATKMTDTLLSNIILFYFRFDTISSFFLNVVDLWLPLTFSIINERLAQLIPMVPYLTLQNHVA